jgi:hypothetical protein
MYIRIEFNNLESVETRETKELLFGSPSGTFLSSSNAFMINSKEIRETSGRSVVFWYVDVDVLNKHYSGVMSCLNSLLTYDGVCRVDVLPIEGPCDVDTLPTILMQKYINGVT